MRRIPELDALRGISALMILALHLGLRKSYPVYASAVDLFFILSGYLITRIILDHGGRPGFLLNFYVRRNLRIWPIYFGLLLAFVAVNPWLPIRQPTRGLAQYLTYTQFIQHYWFAVPPRFCPYLGHTWTLAAEEQFYILWPLATVFLGRRALVVAIPLLIVSAFVARMVFWGQLLICVWDGFALGALLACWLGNPETARSRCRWVSWGLAGLLAATLSYPQWRGPIEEAIRMAWPDRGPRAAESLNTLRLTLGYFAIVGLTIRHAGHPWLRPLRHPVLCYVGTISYGLYLYHFPLFALISPNHFTRWCNDSMALDTFKLVACFAVAIASWEFLEKPLLQLKDRFPYGVARDLQARRAIPRPHLLIWRRARAGVAGGVLIKESGVDEPRRAVGLAGPDDRDDPPR